MDVRHSVSVLFDGKAMAFLRLLRIKSRAGTYAKTIGDALALYEWARKQIQEKGCQIGAIDPVTGEVVREVVLPFSRPLKG